MTFPARLIDGYRSFRQTRLAVEQARYQELAEHGQEPEIMVIGCCDSRVSPEVIFDAGPGELFVVRNVANVVPPYSPSGQAHGVSAALEFAVQGLAVKHIIVLGHARCGGIRAFATKQPPLSDGDFIGRWMSLIAPAAQTIAASGQRSVDDYLTKLELASLRHGLNNLMTFPFVRTPVARGLLQLHTAYFAVGTGMLLIGDPETGQFAPVEGP